MTDQQPPTGPQDPTPPVDPRWDAPLPGETPTQPQYGQPPAYGAPPAHGAPPSQQPVYGQPGPGEQPYAQQSPYGDVVATAAPKSKRGLALGGGALALALVAGGGLYFASQASDGGGDQPETLVPSTAFAFARIDLDPAPDQKVAIHEFASKFPEGPKTDAKDPIDAILSDMFKKEGLGACSYEADIKPWLGKRLGLAAITGASGKTEPLVVVQVKDADKAKAAIAKLDSAECASGDAGSDDDKDDLKGSSFKDGYLVMSTTQADVDAALEAAKTKSLKDSGTFDDDVAKLDGSQVIVMWADLARSFDAAAKQSPELNQIPNGIAKQLKGRVVMGLHMGNNYGELSGRIIGADMSTVTVSSPVNLAKLPKATVIAASVNGVQEQIEKQLSQLGAAGASLDEMLAAVNGQLGLDVRKELLPLLGSTTTLSLGNVPTSPADAQFGLQSTVTDPAAAAKTGTKLKELAEAQGIPLDAEVDGTTFYLTSKGYAATLKGDGGLASSPTFSAAMGELGDQVSGAVFVDVGQLSKAAPKGRGAKEIEHISAFGMSAGKVGDDGYVRIRLVVK